MLIKSSFSARVMAGLVAAGLAACANPRADETHAQHHMGQSAQGGMMGSNAATASGDKEHMNKDAMCAMYRSMRDAPDEQARQAMMERQMQGMSPEMRQRHMEMMRQQCQ